MLHAGVIALQKTLKIDPAIWADGRETRIDWATGTLTLLGVGTQALLHRRHLRREARIKGEKEPPEAGPIDPDNLPGRVWGHLSRWMKGD